MADMLVWYTEVSAAWFPAAAGAASAAACICGVVLAFFRVTTSEGD